MTRQQKWIGVLVAGSALMFAPLVALVVTIPRLIHAFAAVGPRSHVDPANKSQVLADGIAEAMNATAFGVLFFLLGAIVAAVAITKLLRTASRK